MQSQNKVETQEEMWGEFKKFSSGPLKDLIVQAPRERRPYSAMTNALAMDAARGLMARSDC